MAIGERFSAWLLDWAMRQMDDLRPGTTGAASGEVLEIGFGTGLNLRHYGPEVKKLIGVDPMSPDAIGATADRMAAARFPVEHHQLRADGTLPFDAGRFDTVVTTWTLCTIPDPIAALAEMRRVLAPGGRYVFVEHGRAESEQTARWQDRLNPIWKRMAGGCNMNRRTAEIVERGGFALLESERFQSDAPALLSHTLRGVAHVP